MHDKFLKTIKELNKEKNNPYISSILKEPDDVIFQQWFKNYRLNSKRGLRLTDEGLIIFKMFFQSWTIELAGYKNVNSMHLVKIDRIANMPWHLSPEFITTFDSELAMKLSLTKNLSDFFELFG